MKLITLLTFILLTFNCLGDPPRHHWVREHEHEHCPPPPDHGGPICWPPPCVPINKGLVFLAISALALGTYKLKFSNTK
jgi:hypothetical protein